MVTTAGPVRFSPFGWSSELQQCVASNTRSESASVVAALSETPCSSCFPGGMCQIRRAERRLAMATAASKLGRHLGNNAPGAPS